MALEYLTGEIHADVGLPDLRGVRAVQELEQGSAVARLAERYGIKREEVICIGDSDNDLTMIEYAGLGVCVAGGSPAAKKAASLIAPDCDDDPITWLIDRCMQDSL